MVENIKKVSNPLTIIAIFAALAEVNGTVAIGLVSSNLQPTFIWFIILFPTLLIIFFFLTLNFNPKVIYAPSDFQDETNFVKTISGNFYRDEIKYTVSSAENNIDEVKEQIEKNIELVEHSTRLPNTEKLLTEKANAFFKILINDVNHFFDEHLLSELSFGIESAEFFLLIYSIPKDKLNSERSQGGDALIIRLGFESDNSVFIEAIGKDIKETNPQIFANKVSKLIHRQIDNSTNPDKKPKF